MKEDRARACAKRHKIRDRDMSNHPGKHQRTLPTLPTDLHLPGRCKRFPRTSYEKAARSTAGRRLRGVLIVARQAWSRGGRACSSICFIIALLASSSAVLIGSTRTYIQQAATGKAELQVMAWRRAAIVEGPSSNPPFLYHPSLAGGGKGVVVVLQARPQASGRAAAAAGQALTRMVHCAEQRSCRSEIG